ncbi:hypothetical protein ACFFLZ_22360 [Photobacterium aphoticum]|uniref:WalW protein n=1 Tax=Photobacterium aphoticum TaxID=754436 RepID=A0A0J1GMM5_9GAMM|nr:hypothetical protein [Photobacterium aphoticum]KLV01010.1 hypothetical protein ABT58_09365 [Photobacterium aphoticum]PSU58434.1 hypothetical protein C9I90_06815 [Photobacterium aphoticum]GHA37161.1 hypothetical protein GCM10007086_08010 [Photobacterium aphoticum]
MVAKLAVVIHAEEEFDWSGGFKQHQDQVTHHLELITLIDGMIQAGAKVTLAMDYPFVTSDGGQQVVAHCQRYEKHHIEFAAHLHPWVTPPFDEQSDHKGEVANVLSYPGNLTAELEFEKLRSLTEAIEAVTGQRPVTYLAGRYGIGPNTASILKRLGYKVDLSISAFSDFTHQEGPDFSRYNNKIFTEGAITYLPHTCCRLSAFAPLTKVLNDNPTWLSHQGLASRVVKKLLGVKTYRLSPEGSDLDDMITATENQIRLGHDHLIMSFHSPTVKQGMTPYVSSQDEQQVFIDTTVDFIKWFKGVPNTEMITPASILRAGGHYAKQHHG